MILAEDPPPQKSPGARYDYSLLFLLPIMFIFLISSGPLKSGSGGRRCSRPSTAATRRGGERGIVGTVDKIEKGEGGEDELLIKIDPMPT